MPDYKPSGAREIRKAGIAFLKMKDRIERQTAKRTQMLAMISHDLKTPLTRMKLQVELMGRGMAWLDTGTHESLLEAAQFIATLEKRQGLKVACPEEVAYRKGYINAAQVEKLAEPLKKNAYGQYLLRMLKEKVY